MFDTPLFAALFSFTGIASGVLIPLVIVQLFALILIPSLLQHGANPRTAVHASYCYLMQALGVLLMTAGGLPTVISVLAQAPLSGGMYFALLLIFATGGLLFLWHESMAGDIDSASRSVPEAIYMYLFKLLGHIIVLLWGLSVVMDLLGGLQEPGWWVMPLVLIPYGALLIWCTNGATIKPKKSFFQSIAIQPPKHPAPARKRASRKVVRKRKK